MQRYRGSHAHRRVAAGDKEAKAASAAAADDAAGGSSTSSEPRARPSTPQKDEGGHGGADSKNTPATTGAGNSVPQRPRSQRVPAARGGAQSESSSEEYGSGSRTKRKASSLRQPFSFPSEHPGVAASLLILLDAAEELNRQQLSTADSVASKRLRQAEEAAARDTSANAAAEEADDDEEVAQPGPSTAEAAAAASPQHKQQPQQPTQQRPAQPPQFLPPAFAVQPPVACGSSPASPVFSSGPAVVLARLADGMVAQLIPVVGEDPQMLSRALYAYARSCQMQGRGVEAEAAVVRSWELFRAAAGEQAPQQAVVEAFERMKRDVGAVLLPQFGVQQQPSPLQQPPQEVAAA